MIIDKTAFFAVHMAKTLLGKDANHKSEVLQQIHPRARKLINLAFVALAKKDANNVSSNPP